MANSSCCSGRPVPARRRRCGWSPASKGRIAARIADRRPRRHQAGAGRARRRLRVPAIFALPASEVYENLAFPLRSPARRMPEDQIRRRVEEVARMVRIDHKLDNRSTQAVRRRDAARRHRPRAGAQAGDLPDGRAAVLARRQAARRTAARTEAHPGRTRRDRALRHARPDRGDDHGRPHRHPGRWRAGADRLAARRSTRSRPTCMSRRASASRRSTCCPSACCPTRRCRPAPRRSARAPST